jgi:hypothetical protein
MKKTYMAAMLVLGALVGWHGCYKDVDESGMISSRHIDDWVDHGDFRASVEKPLLASTADAFHPSVAFNGSEAGLVYRSGRSAEDAALRFAPLDPWGSPTGPDVAFLEDPGLAGSVPRISSSDDGRFLVCSLLQSPRRLSVALIEEDGTVECSVETGVDDDVKAPLSAPVEIGNQVFVVAGISWGHTGEVALYRFSYPDLAMERWARMWSWDQMGIIHPVALRGYDNGLLVVNSKHYTQTHVAVEDVYLDEMAYTGAITTYGSDEFSNPVLAQHASSSPATWFGYTIIDKGGGSAWQIMRFDPIADHELWEPFWFGEVYPCSGVGPIMDSDTSDEPSSAAVFSVHMEGRWQVWVHVIDGAGSGAVWDTFSVGSVEASADPTLAPNPTVVWTGLGFLVVWDELGASLAMSYVDAF